MNKKANNNELKKQNTELENQLKVQKEEFEKEIKELTTQLEELTKEKAELSKTIDRLTEKNQELRQELTKKSHQVPKIPLEEDIVEETKELSEREKQLQELISKKKEENEQEEFEVRIGGWLFSILFLVIPIVLKIIFIHDSHLKTKDYAKSFKDEFFTTGKISGNIGCLLSLIASFYSFRFLLREQQNKKKKNHD